MRKEEAEHVLRDHWGIYGTFGGAEFENGRYRVWLSPPASNPPSVVNATDDSRSAESARSFEHALMLLQNSTRPEKPLNTEGGTYLRHAGKDRPDSNPPR